MSKIRSNKTAITGVGVVVEDDGKFLCVIETYEDKNLNKKQNSLTFPQGHLDIYVSPIEMAKIEVLEEAGYFIRIKSIIGIYFIGTALGIVFSGKLDKYKKPIVPSTKEAKKILWLKKEDILENNNVRPAVKEALYDYLEGKEYPLELITEIRI